jgi:hypothetical protein
MVRLMNEMGELSMDDLKKLDKMTMGELLVRKRRSDVWFGVLWFCTWLLGGIAIGMLAVEILWEIYCG